MSIYDVFSGGNRPFDKEEWAAAKQAQRKEAYELIDLSCIVSYIAHLPDSRATFSVPIDTGRATFPVPIGTKNPSHTLRYERVFFNIPVHPH